MEGSRDRQCDRDVLQEAHGGFLASGLEGERVHPRDVLERIGGPADPQQPLADPQVDVGAA
jgi:hypothetical protein